MATNALPDGIVFTDAHLLTLTARQSLASRERQRPVAFFGSVTPIIRLPHLGYHPTCKMFKYRY